MAGGGGGRGVDSGLLRYDGGVDGVGGRGLVGKCRADSGHSARMTEGEGMAGR